MEHFEEDLYFNKQQDQLITEEFFCNNHIKNLNIPTILIYKTLYSLSVQNWRKCKTKIFEQDNEIRKIQKYVRT